MKNAYDLFNAFIATQLTQPHIIINIIKKNIDFLKKENQEIDPSTLAYNVLLHFSNRNNTYLTIKTEELQMYQNLFFIEPTYIIYRKKRFCY